MKVSWREAPSKVMDICPAAAKDAGTTGGGTRVHDVKVVHKGTAGTERAQRKTCEKR